MTSTTAAPASGPVIPGVVEAPEACFDSASGGLEALSYRSLPSVAVSEGSELLGSAKLA
jgi:hypothetical protein